MINSSIQAAFNIRGNYIATGGGAATFSQGSVTLSNCVFDKNATNNAGGELDMFALKDLY